LSGEKAELIRLLIAAALSSTEDVEICDSLNPGVEVAIYTTTASVLYKTTHKRIVVYQLSVTHYRGNSITLCAGLSGILRSLTLSTNTNKKAITLFC